MNYKKRIRWKKIRIVIILVLILICNCTCVNAVTEKLNHENFNISFQNIDLNDEITIELENYDERFTNDTNYLIIRVTFKNNKIIEAYEADKNSIAEHKNDIIDKTSLTQDGEIITLKIDDLSPNSICLAVNIDFQISIYRNGDKVIDRSSYCFDDDLFKTDGYNRYYYSDIKIDLSNKSIIEDEFSFNYMYIALIIFVTIVFIIIILVVIVKKRHTN